MHRTSKIGLCFFGLAMGAFAQSDWTWRNPLPQGNRLNSVAWSGDRFVAVGEHGAIVASMDGAAWRNENSGTDVNLNHLARIGNQLVAVGAGNTILTSPDGIAWTKRNGDTSVASHWLNCVVGMDSQMVALGTHVDANRNFQAIIMSSPDGAVWTERKLKGMLSAKSVAWTGSRLVAVGDDSVTWSSSDGVNWKNDSNDIKRSGAESIIWMGNQFVAVGYLGKILLSPDGVRWTEVFSKASATFMEVIWTGTQLVAVELGGKIWTSPNGTEWQSHAWEKAYQLTSVASSGSKMVAVGAYGSMISSPDGVAWSHRSVGVNAPEFNAIHWAGPAGAMAVGYFGTICASKDGITWRYRVSGTTNDLNSVVWTGSLWVAVGEGGTILTSTDGLSWTGQNVAGYRNLKTVLWTGDKLVAAELDSILTSTDGLAWARVAKVPRIQAMTWTGTQIVGVGEQGAIYTSPDAIHWTNRVSGTSAALRAVAWTGSMFGAAGSDVFLTSPDGENWTSSSLVDFNPYGMVWAESVFVVVGRGGAIHTSPDGRSWTTRNSGTYNWLFAVTNSNGRLLAAGANATIIASSDGSITRIAARLIPSDGLSLRCTRDALYFSAPPSGRQEAVSASIHNLKGRQESVEVISTEAGTGIMGSLPIAKLPLGKHLFKLRTKDREYVKIFTKSQ